MRIFSTLKKGIFLSVLSICSLNLAAQNANYEIKTTNGRFAAKVSTEKEFNLKSEIATNGKAFRLIQFYAIPTEKEKSDWKAQGLLISDYFPNFSYFAVISGNFNLASIQSKIRSIIVPDATIKLETPLYRYFTDSLKANDRLPLVISYYELVDYPTIVRELAALNIKVGQHRNYSRQIDIEILSSQLKTLVDLPFIQFIGSQEEEPINEATNLSYRNTAGAANFLNTGQNGLQFNGTGVTIAIGEGGTVDNLIEFKGRLTELETGALSTHKQGTGQNALGAGNLDPTNRNNAWGASIISSNTQAYSTLIQTYNVRYFNHSYGTSIQGGYNSQARDHDLRTKSYPNHMVFYSSGNSGNDTGYAPYDNFASWGNLTGTMKQNKNHLVVANLSPENDIYSWGCKGPAYDGRIIPQLTIAGPEGTSYASPKAVGVFAVLEEAFKAKNSGTESDATLMKGIVLNTADDMGNPGPDFRTGYGRPNTRRAYQVIEDGTYFLDSVSNGQIKTQTIAIPPNLNQVKIMLIWPDLAASVNANPAIVNNLNLQAISPSSTTYNPWVLNSAADTAMLNANAVRGIDSINTVEQVTIDHPDAGNWTFSVNGAMVPTGPQRYYVVYEFVKDSLNFEYPLANEKMISMDEYQLKWANFGNANAFSLAYRLDGGSWINIVQDLDSNARLYTWNTPYVTGVHQIEFRIQNGTKTAISGINYIAQRPESFRIAKVCNDTVILKWSAMQDATAYKVYRLGAKYMEEVTSNITFNGPSAVLTLQSTTGDEYYAVSAVTGTFEGQRTIALMKSPGDFNCGGIYWTGTISTDWFDGGNWASGTAPTNLDNAIIPSTAPFKPVINAAGSVCHDLHVESGASLGFSNTTNYTLSMWGDWKNEGTFTAGIGTVAFIDTLGYQEIAGSSASNFYKIRVSKKLEKNILEVNSPINLTGTAPRLDLFKGTFKLSYNSTITPFTSNTNSTLTKEACLWNNGGIIKSTSANNWLLNGGVVKQTQGTMTIGDQVNDRLRLAGGGGLFVNGGTVNIAAGIVPNSGTTVGKVELRGGNLNLNIYGSTNTGAEILSISPGGTFNMYDGTLTIQSPSSVTSLPSDIKILAANHEVIGGTVVIGNSSSSVNKTFRVTSVAPFYNVVINSTKNPTLKLISSNLEVVNNININGGTLDANNLNIAVAGNWTNNSSFVSGIDTIIFNGKALQTIAGTAKTTFNSIQLENRHGIDLQASTALSGTAIFNKGNIVTNTDTLIFEDNSLAINASTQSHVVGNCRKVGDDAFEFPVGSASLFAPIAISAPALATDHFTALYNPSNPDTQYPVAFKETTIDHVSQCEYWILNRTNGNSSVNVTMTWSPASCGITNLTDLVVARWDAGQAKWMNEGNGGTTGSTSAGTLVTGAAVSSFSPFTFGSKSSSNPLPTQLKEFNCAIASKTSIGLAWTTFTESNCAFFEVQRSDDGIKFESIGKMQGAGNSTVETNYKFVDHSPNKGTQFYRIKQVDFDGKVQFSQVCSSIFEGLSSIAFYPNPVAKELIVEFDFSQIDKKDFFTITDVLGKQMQVPHSVSNSRLFIACSGLVEGVYVLKIKVGTQEFVQKFVVKH